MCTFTDSSFVLGNLLLITMTSYFLLIGGGTGCLTLRVSSGVGLRWGWGFMVIRCPSGWCDDGKVLYNVMGLEFMGYSMVIMYLWAT